MKYGEKVFETTLTSMGLTPRPQQTKLIETAREVFNNRGSIAFRQAGTGTGKSYVLLSAALEAARSSGTGSGPLDTPRTPAVVVCPTNNLIDQYVHQDAPKLAKATGGKFEYLKGRNRYLCTASFQMSQERDPNGMFKKLTGSGKLEWAQHGLDNSYGCSGDCDPKLGDLCAVQIAREQASHAEVIITNGHLLVWDWRILLWTQGAVGLLPVFNTLFVDECHALEEVGRSVMSDQIKRNSAVFKEVPGLDKWVDRVVREGELSDFKREIPLDLEDPQLAQLVKDSEQYRDMLVGQLERAVSHQDRALARVLKKQVKAQDRFIAFATPGEDGKVISTITMEMQGGTEVEPALNSLCVDSSDIFRSILTRQPSLLVSGTVPETLPRRMGVSNVPLEDVGTPFDYSRSTLAISSHRGNDNNAMWNRVKETVAAVNDMAGRSHENGGGGTLILFTSWRDLNEVMGHVAKGLKHDVPVFAQSSDPKDTAECLASFKAHGHAVMGGVTSMWTGVDVPGPALRQVIIFRLPWGVPTLEVKAVEKIHGRAVYSDSMLQVLAQGIGRLIRTTEDDGRVYIADSRAKNIRWTASPLTKHVAQFGQHARRANA